MSHLSQPQTDQLFWKLSMDHHQDGASRNYSEEDLLDLRKGPWSIDEDFALINYIAHRGEGRWNSLARSAGLKRTGKSCRLRWLNYLRPNVRRGNITIEEQLLILELHSRWGNRWSKIAQHLPGRTDNEIKNYWRTRVQKHAKQLNCDVNSKQFKDTMRYLWMPRLVERIQASATAARGGNGAAAVVTPTYHHLSNQNSSNLDMGSTQIALPHAAICVGGGVHTFTPENSSATASSGSFETECYNNYPNNQDYYPANNKFSYGDHSLTSPTGYFNQGLDFFEQSRQWMMDGGDVLDSLWSVNDVWLLQQ